jgi:DNA polymerase III delta subunit
VPTLAPDAFLRLPAAKRRAAAVVVLAGDEAFFKEEALAALEASLEGAERVERRCQSGARAATQDLAPILDELRTGSLFAAAKVLVVRDAEALVQGAPEAVLGHAKGGRAGGAPGTTLVLDVGGLDKRTRVAKELDAAALVVDCKRLYADPPPWVRAAGPGDSPLVQWALARARAAGLSARPETAHALVQVTGNDLHEIAATIEKARLSGASELGEAEVEALAGRTRREDAFALADAVGRRDLARALALLARLFERGIADRKGGVIGDPGAVGAIVFGRLYAKLGEVRRALAHLERGGARSREAVAQALGIAPFLADRALADAERWRAADLRAAWRALLDADLGLKGALPSGGPRAALERLLVALLHREGATATIPRT